MLRIGTILRGIYRIDSFLSSGGFGNTYMATNIEFNEQCAIKEFFMKGTTERNIDSSQVSVSNADNVRTFEEQREKFKKEARRLRKLNNPYIVKVHDMFEENGTAYYVMDYVDGENLKTYTKRTGCSMKEDEVLKILPQILNALKSVHDEGLWHFDIKPANIMLDKSGKVKLIDFGASKQLNVQKGGGTRTAVSYTVGYAPREQMEQNYDKFGPWTDLYALGATLYTLLVMKEPPKPSDIDDDTSEDKHIALPMPENVSEKTKHLILWLMQTDRKKRPQSVDEVLETLDENEKEDNAIVEISDNNTNNKNKIVIAFIAALVSVVGIYLVVGGVNPASDDVKTKTVSNILTVKDSLINNNEYGSGSYNGEINSDNRMPEGKGSIHFKKDNLVYEGHWVSGAIEGEGKMIYINDNIVMTGTFEDNLFIKGKCTMSDGTYFEGDFKDGQPYNGTWYKKNGTFDYKYKNGEPI